MKKFFGRFGISLLFSFSVFPLFAQNSLVLTLDESIDIALDRSYNIQTLQQYVITSERNLWAAKAAYNTNISASLFAPEYDEGFTLIDQIEGNPVAKQTGSFRVRSVLDVRQPMPWLPWGGGDLIFRSEAYQLNSWTPSFMDPDIELKSNKFYSSLSAILQKPLFTINTVSLELQQAELEYERQSRFFKRSELDLVYDVTQSFFHLYQRSQQVEINREKVQRQEEIYRTTKNKFDAGLIAEVDAMQAEVDLIQYQNELKTAEGRLNEQEAIFKQLIGVPLEADVKVVTELEVKSPAIDLERAVALAIQNRSELVEKRIDIENRKIDIRQTDARVSVKGNLIAYYKLAGFSDPNMPFGTPTGDLFESSWEILKKTPNKGVTFELEIPIWDWGRNKAQVQAQEAILRREQLNLNNLHITIEREVRDVVRKVYEAYDRVQMLEKSREVSERSFNISLQRFANGDITSVELARASEQLDTAKLTYLNAYNEYKLALADLKRKTLYDFEKNRSLVELN
ncbi:MAG TPA: TolC family protein [bacterium]|nr:TolC family protein [bacterium]